MTREEYLKSEEFKNLSRQERVKALGEKFPAQSKKSSGGGSKSILGISKPEINMDKYRAAVNNEEARRLQHNAESEKRKPLSGGRFEVDGKQVNIMKPFQMIGEAVDTADKWIEEKDLYSKPASPDTVTIAKDNPMVQRMPEARDQNLENMNLQKQGFDRKDISFESLQPDPSQYKDIVQIMGLDNDENIVDPKTGKMNMLKAGMTNSIVVGGMGYKRHNLPEDASLKDELMFTVGKMVFDLPVIAGVGFATGGAGVGPLGASTIAFGAYEGLDRGVDAYARNKHGQGTGLNPVSEGLGAVPMGAAKGAFGHIGGVLGGKLLQLGGFGAIKAIDGITKVAGRSGTSAATADKVLKILQPMGYLAAENEIQGQMGALQHGTDYTMRNRLIDAITTGTIAGGTMTSRVAGARAVDMFKKYHKETDAFLDGNPKLDGLEAFVDSLVEREIKQTAKVAAQRNFIRGGTPEESARLTVEHIREVSKSENMGHPYKNPQDLENYLTKIYDEARKLDSDNSELLNLNKKDGVLIDGTKIADLGKDTRGKTKMKELQKLRGEERELTSDYYRDAKDMTTQEMETRKLQIEEVRQKQLDLIDKVQTKSRTEVYALMKKDAGLADARADYMERSALSRDLFFMEEQPYSTEAVSLVTGLTEGKVIDVAMRANRKKDGKVKWLYDNTLRSAHRRLEMNLGKEGADMLKAALRGAEAAKTKDQVRNVEMIERARKNVTAEEGRLLIIHNYLKQKARRTVKHEDGSKTKEQVLIGEDLVQDMVDMGYISADEVAAARTLSPKLQEIHNSTRAMLDDSWEKHNKSRKIMGDEEIAPLDDYYPLSTDLDDIDINGYSKFRDGKIAEFGEKDFRNRQSPGPSKNTKQRVAKKGEVLSLDYFKVLEDYLKYNTNKIYMNPVAFKMYQIGKAINKIHGTNAGTDLINHAKFISGDMDTLLGATADRYLAAWTRNASQAMLFYNYSTYVTQLSAIDGIYAECGARRVSKAIKDLQENPALWDEIVRQSAHLTARKGGGEISTVDLQNSLKSGLRKKVIEKGMYPIQVLDMVAATIGWKAFYDRAISNGMHDIDARIAADDFVVKTQASASRIDVPPVYRNVLGKNIFSLQTFALNRFDYMVSDIFGVKPVYKFMKLVDDYDVAVRLQKETGWTLEAMQDGKRGYALYDKQSSVDYMAATKKLMRLMVAGALFNMVYDVAEELTFIPFAKPSPDVVGAFIEEKYGVSTTGKFLGRPEKNSSLTEDQRNWRATVVALQEFAEYFPLVSSILKYQESMTGAPMSKFISANKKLIQALKTGNPLTAADAINDYTVMFGNPAYAVTSKVITGFKRFEKDQEREDRLFDDKIKALKKSQKRTRDSRPSRPNLRIER
jgi:hypothetical protein